MARPFHQRKLLGRVVLLASSHANGSVRSRRVGAGQQALVARFELFGGQVQEVLIAALVVAVRQTELGAARPTVPAQAAVRIDDLMYDNASSLICRSDEQPKQKKPYRSAVQHMRVDRRLRVNVLDEPIEAFALQPFAQRKTLAQIAMIRADFAVDCLWWM